MLKMLYKRYKRWRESVERQRYEAGWDWAAGELLRGRSAEEIEEHVSSSIVFDDNPLGAHFDNGATGALRAWTRIWTRALRGFP